MDQVVGGVGMREDGLTSTSNGCILCTERGRERGSVKSASCDLCTYVAATGRKRTLFHCEWANSISYYL